MIFLAAGWISLMVAFSAENHPSRLADLGDIDLG
jgi:hypothetical protein